MQSTAEKIVGQTHLSKTWWVGLMEKTFLDADCYQISQLLKSSLLSLI